MDGRTRRLKANVVLIYGVRITAMAFVLAVPTLVRYWQMHGLSLAQVTLLQSVFAVSLAMGQGPTGYFADLFERRLSICIGAALDLVGALLYLNASSFAGFLAAEITLGIGMSFISGADRALLFESLAELETPEAFERVWSHINGLSLFGMAVGALVGGLLASYNPRYPFAGAAIMLGLQLLFSLPLAEPRRRVLKVGGRFGAAFGDILRRCWTNPRLRGLLLCSAWFVTFNQLGLWLYNPYFELCKLPLSWWGAAFAFFNLVAAGSSWAVPGLAVRYGERRLLWSMVALQGLGYLLLGSLAPLLGFTFIFLHQMVRGSIPGTIGASITRAADDEVRATVSSIESLLFTLAYSILLIPVGLSAEHVGLQPTFLVLAVLSLLGGLAVVGTLRPADP